MTKIHFIGIGGIGISALARFYLAQGNQVSGSDLIESEITKGLSAAGAIIKIGHDSQNVPDDADLIIYSAAVNQGNPEIIKAKSLEAKTFSYAQALGELTKKYFTLAVSGSHGKSTTTALLSLMLIKAGLDPTVIIGTRLAEFGGVNFRLGKSRYLVIEADEWNNSFHYYYPRIVVLTNIDKEHLDTHKNLAGVIKNFQRYLNNVGEQGSIIVNAQDKNSLAAVKNQTAKIIHYNNLTKSDFVRWPLAVPGEFNQLNCEAAWQAAKLLDVSLKDARSAVKKFQGSWRRWEKMTPKAQSGLCKRCVYLSDYGHHPTEIKAVGEALKKEFPKKKKVVIFQPHQIERLNNLFKEFTQSFSDFDFVGIYRTYEVAGREYVGRKKTAKDLADKIKARYLNNFEEAIDYIKSLRKQFSQEKLAVVFMGAGDIDNEVRKYFDSKIIIK